MVDSTCDGAGYTAEARQQQECPRECWRKQLQSKPWATPPAETQGLGIDHYLPNKICRGRYLSLILLIIFQIFPAVPLTEGVPHLHCSSSPQKAATV